MKVLIANRGEIAVRIERTCHELGIEVASILVPDDEMSRDTVDEQVEVPSYLDQAAIIEAATEVGADAIHPGYGFLAENAEFAQAVVDAGLTWIGPRAEVIAEMGSKIHARKIAEAAGVPLIPGFAASQDDDELAAAAERIGFPILVKASAGGGGKGIRIARSADEFVDALAQARTEAERAFGDGSVIVERYVERPRHIEVQVIGDVHGNVFHLGTRECSIQRRYQKLLEEAPAPNLPEVTRNGLHEAAVRLAKSVGYESAGTVEFIVDDESGDFFFLEMNTRLQVEHPVTEEVTGLDLVELMISIARGEVLDDLSEIQLTGHSFEARITAEDPWLDFAPSTGLVRVVKHGGARWDAALIGGMTVTPTYDSMIAKVIVHGPDRDGALDRLGRALNRVVISGIVTTAPLHRWLVDQPAVRAGRVTTRFLDEEELLPRPDIGEALAFASYVVEEHVTGPLTGRPGRSDAPLSTWHDRPGFTLTPHAPAVILHLRDIDGVVHEVMRSPSDGPIYGSFGVIAPGPERVAGSGVVRRPLTVAVNRNGYTHTFTVVSDRSESWLPNAGDRAGTGDALTAPFPASVAEVHVAPGDEVVADQVLVVIEAMKMLHSLKADGAATVDEVLVAVNDQITGGQSLVTFTTEPEPTDP